LSLAAAELADGATTRAEALLQKLIMDPRAGSADRARATGLLGDVLDASARYGEAFSAYATCNEALRRIHQRFANATSVLAYTRALSSAMSTLAPGAWPTEVAPPATPADPLEHVFLLGFPRSGTTLLEVILDGHPQVESLEEYELLIDGVRRFMREPVNFEPLARADQRELNALRTAYWQSVRRAGLDVAGKVFIDKNPLNTLKLPLIARLFPRAKILFARRDPRDVVLSCFRRRFTMNSSMYALLTLEGAAAFYDAVMQFAEQVRPLLGLSWRIVRYENLVAGFEQESQAICEFLNLQRVEGMQDFAGRMGTRERATPSTAQLARGLSSSAIGSWRRYSRALEPTLPVLNTWVQRFGYPP